MNFEINLIFLIKSFFPKSRDRNLNILRMKRAFKMKWKAFFIIFKGFSIKQATQIFSEGENIGLQLSRTG